MAPPCERDGRQRPFPKDEGSVKRLRWQDHRPARRSSDAGFLRAKRSDSIRSLSTWASPGPKRAGRLLSNSPCRTASGSEGKSMARRGGKGGGRVDRAVARGVRRVAGTVIRHAVEAELPEAAPFIIRALPDPTFDDCPDDEKDPDGNCPDD